MLRGQVANAAKRTADLTQEADSTETGLSYLGSAVAPKSAEFPKIPLVILGGLFLGLAIGAGIAILIELLRRRVRAPTDLVFEGVPLLGVATIATPAAPNRFPGHLLKRLLPPRASAS